MLRSSSHRTKSFPSAGRKQTSVTTPTATASAGRAPPACRPRLLAAAGAAAFLALALTLAHDRTQLLDRLLHFLFARAVRWEQRLRALEMAERLLELTAQTRGDREVIETLRLITLAAECQAGESV